ncbi:hypothetical protein, partial [Chromohalobacter japonicus]|uniref:hypothetical protein n=1 Tax=Chromohalobacter japonicus TaxID=223900 RepID=UPI001C37621F
MNPHSRWQAHCKVYGAVCLILQGKRREKRANSHRDRERKPTQHLGNSVRSATREEGGYAKGNKQG